MPDRDAEEAALPADALALFRSLDDKARATIALDVLRHELGWSFHGLTTLLHSLGWTVSDRLVRGFLSGRSNWPAALWVPLYCWGRAVRQAREAAMREVPIPRRGPPVTMKREAAPERSANGVPRRPADYHGGQR